MSHQDHGRNTASRYHHQALRVALDWLLADVVWTGIGFRQDCRWSSASLARTALLWVWSDEKTLTDRFAVAAKIARLADGEPDRPATSYQAFTKMLRNWTAFFLGALMVAFRQRMQADLAERFTVGGYGLFAVDGSRLELARTASHEARYSPRKSQRIGKKTKQGKQQRKTKKNSRRSTASRLSHARQMKANSPQMWLTTMWHVGTGLPWDWRLGPSDSSERDHWRQMLPGLPAGALITADAGFVGYEYWKEVLESGRQLLIRVGANVRLLKKLGYVRERGNLVYLWPDKAAAKNQPPLVLRLVVMHTGRHPMYIVTSVLVEEHLTDEQVLDIYRQRWGIEVFYRHLKQTFERRKLRSHSADNAEVEAHWSLLGLWAMALHAQYELSQQGLPSRRLSMAGMLRAYRKPMREYKSRPDPGEDFQTLLSQALLDEYQRADKSSRNYPRKKQSHPLGAPEITVASQQQRQHAQKIKREQKGLTA
jgi:hypothetical protein